MGTIVCRKLDKLNQYLSEGVALQTQLWISTNARIPRFQHIWENVFWAALKPSTLLDFSRQTTQRHPKPTATNSQMTNTNQPRSKTDTQLTTHDHTHQHQTEPKQNSDEDLQTQTTTDPTGSSRVMHTVQWAGLLDPSWGYSTHIRIYRHTAWDDVWFSMK